MSSLRQSAPPILILLLILTAACRPATETVPTFVPVATVPSTLPATATGVLPPTRDLSQAEDEAASQPTAVPPTRRPTATPEPLTPVVTIITPGDNSQLVMGSLIVASGLAQMEPDHSLVVRIVSANGRTLTETVAGRGEDNSWQTSLAVPEQVSGPAQLQALIQSPAGEGVARDHVGVLLSLDTSTADRYLALFRPLSGDTVVAGNYLFFDGFAQRPAGGVTISLWTGDCQTEAARQFFSLRSSTYWSGFLGVPRNVSGPACAVAYIGVPGEETYREAQAPVSVLPAEDSETRAVIIASPRPGAELDASQPLTVYGTAYNAVNGEVLVSILLDNGRVLTEGVAEVDSLGYWELTVAFLPDTAGVAIITASTGSPTTADYAETQNRVTIVPAAP